MRHLRLPLFLIASLLATQAMAGKQASPPLPPPPSSPVVFHEGTDTYGCGEGEPVHLASELIAFDEKYDYKGVIDSDKYNYAKMVTNWIVVVPPPLSGSGVITAHIAVSSKGLVKDFILECSTDPALNEAMSAAIRRAKFKPATHKGVAVDSVETIAIYSHRK